MPIIKSIKMEKNLVEIKFQKVHNLGPWIINNNNKTQVRKV
jgi:hypothetical protein